MSPTSGTLVQLEEGIEGLVHISEISKEKSRSRWGCWDVGDNLEGHGRSASLSDDRKIGPLSVKALEDGVSKEEY